MQGKLVGVISLGAIGLWLLAFTYYYASAFALVLFLYLALDLGLPVKSNHGKLQLARRVSASNLVVGEQVTVETSVTNNGKSVSRLQLTDSPPPKSKVDAGVPGLVCGVHSGEKVTLRYVLSFTEPGVYQFGQTALEVSTPFGLSSEKWYAPVQTRVVVYPKYANRHLDIPSSRTFSWAGIIPSKSKGGRDEFLTIRAYEFGDPLKNVNWKATARSKRTMVNEWSVDRGLDVVVVVDLSDENIPAVGDWSARASVIQAAYELTLALAKRGNRVGALILGSSLSKLRPGFGHRKLRQILDELVKTEVGSVWEVEHAEDLLELFFRAQYRKRSGTLYFVTTGTSSRTRVAIMKIASKGFVCNIIFVNELEDELASLLKVGKSDAKRLAAGFDIAKAERKWIEKSYSEFSNVYEWTSSSGFVVVRAF